MKSKQTRGEELGMELSSIWSDIF